MELNTPRDRRETLASLQLVASAALFSTGGAAIKACTLSGWQVAGLRSAVAAAVLVLLLPAARRRPDRHTFVVALAYAATLISFVRATKLTTAASAIFLQSVAPLYVLLLAPLLLHERLRRRDLGFMAAFAAGLVLLLSGTDMPSATAPDPGAGNRWATASALFWALTLIGLRHAARRDPDAALSAVTVGNFFAAAGALPLAAPWPQVTLTDAAVIAYLGTFQIGLAYMFLARGMRHVSALRASLILLVEPVLNPIWAWILQGEVPEAASVIGGAVILGTTVLMTWREQNFATTEGNTRGYGDGTGSSGPGGASLP